MFWLGLIWIGIVFVVYSVSLEAFRRGEAMRHQDISCMTGAYSFFAEDVVVSLEEDRILIEYPDGRRRAVLEGSCEWAPHSPEGEYESEETQSWQGSEPDRSERNA